MQQHIEQMIAERGVAPQPVFDPKRRMQHRVELLGGAELKPDASQPGPRAQVRPGDVAGVIPKEPARQRG